MYYIKILINISWYILILGGIIWSIINLIKIILIFMYNFITKTLKIRRVNKRVVKGLIINKKYHRGRGGSKASPMDIPNVYELIVKYEGYDYIITTTRKVYENSEVDNNIDLLLIEYFKYNGDRISYNLKINKRKKNLINRIGDNHEN